MPGQDLDVVPDFAAEMSSRKLFFRQPALLSPANDRDQPASIHIALAQALLPSCEVMHCSLTALGTIGIHGGCLR
jgi:hypothetical protein